MERTGIIKSIQEKVGTGQKGTWKNYVFEFTDGFKCGTFDKDIGDNFQAGQEVEVEVDQNGAFFNIKRMELLRKGGGVAAKQQAEIMPASNRETLIIAQTLTKCVCENSPDKVTREFALETFKWFLNNL